MPQGGDGTPLTLRIEDGPGLSSLSEVAPFLEPGQARQIVMVPV